MEAECAAVANRSVEFLSYEAPNTPSQVDFGRNPMSVCTQTAHVVKLYTKSTGMREPMAQQYRSTFLAQLLLRRLLGEGDAPDRGVSMMTYDENGVVEGIVDFATLESGGTAGRTELHICARFLDMDRQHTRR